MLISNALVCNDSIKLKLPLSNTVMKLLSRVLRDLIQIIALTWQKGHLKMQLYE